MQVSALHSQLIVQGKGAAADTSDVSKLCIAKPKCKHNWSINTLYLPTNELKFAAELLGTFIHISIC